MIPGKYQTEDIQKTFVNKILSTVEDAKKSNGKEVVLSFDPMHQIHNNENGYAWQIRGKDGTKRVLSNTGRRKLNILGAIDLNSKDIVPLITEINCNKEVIKVFLNEVVDNLVKNGETSADEFKLIAQRNGIKTEIVEAKKIIYKGFADKYEKFKELKK